MRPRFRRLLVLPVAALLAAFLTPGSVASADPVPNFYIQVSAATEPYGLAPIFQYNPVYGGLPPGATLVGHASCSQVYSGGTYGPSESSFGTGGHPLDPGSYHFVPGSCTEDSSFPLTLDGIGGSYNLVLLSGSYTVTQAQTDLGGAGVQGPLVGDAPTPTTLTAVVLNASNDDNELAGLTVNFSLQLQNSVWDVNVCTAVTADTGTGHYAATCTLSTQEAAELYASTGQWLATFSGNKDFAGSSYTGQSTGQVTEAQAVANLAAQPPNSVTFVAYYVSPECDNPYAGQDDGDIISVSLGELDCSQLQVLQITTGVVLGIALVAGAGSGVIIDAAEEAAFNVAKLAVQTYLNEIAEPVTVANPFDVI